MCRSCRHSCRGIRFDFKCKNFYHDYCKSSSYVKPDIIFFFNPDLHAAGFRGFDTWPKTVIAALDVSTPIAVTSCTEKDSFLDFEAVQKIAQSGIDILEAPKLNPYASTNPERNIANEEAPIMFRNQFYFIVHQAP